jgi:desulfoferrodoxin-like iron-binding protein
MTAKQRVYSCGVCGQMVAVVHQGGGRLVCCGQPMMPAGEEAAGKARVKPKIRQEPFAVRPSAVDAPHWQCSKCHYVLQAAQPPETCPSCHEHCQFVDVTCYIPECGFSGIDSRLVG